MSDDNGLDCITQIGMVLLLVMSGFILGWMFSPDAHPDKITYVSVCGKVVKGGETEFQDTEGNIWIMNHCYKNRYYDVQVGSDYFITYETNAFGDIRIVKIQSVKEVYDWYQSLDENKLSQEDNKND